MDNFVDLFSKFYLNDLEQLEFAFKEAGCASRSEIQTVRNGSIQFGLTGFLLA